jgi:hypothetical protein
MRSEVVGGRRRRKKKKNSFLRGLEWETLVEFMEVFWRIERGSLNS